MQILSCSKVITNSIGGKVRVARQMINLIENNKYKLSLDLCLKLVWELNTDLNTLFWKGKR
ncbi:DNA-binding protein [Companilactobacillus farciminis]|nr:DNA-binding protein [Companilactobacillus farciminis]